MIAKSTRRIAVLIMCALLVTVGGVFATWNYAQGSVQKFNSFIAKPAMAEAKLDAAIGTLSIDTSSLKVTVDDTNGDKVAELVASGGVTINFTPNPSADPDIQQNGIAMKYTITGAANPQYNGSPIFAFTDVVNTTGKCKTYTIGANELLTAMRLNGSISLPTYANYQAIQQQLPSNLLSITVEAAGV